MNKNAIKLLYINDELATGDGSNSHAVGMLSSLERLLGTENVQSYPQAEDGSTKPTCLNAKRFRKRFKGLFQIIRYFRKRYLSIKKSKNIIVILEKQNFVPTHVIARSTVFDTTAIHLAKQFNAELIYEINTPMYYECGIVQKEPLMNAVEKWEQQIIEASDLIYTVSAVCRNMLCEHYHLTHEKFFVVPNGYMEELYTETEEEREAIRNEVRKQENLEGKFIIIFIGSLKVWHGIENLCEMAKLLVKKDKFHFIVIGDGDKHDLITDYISHYNNMLFKGKVKLDIMKRYLYASDLGIMPYEKNNHFYFSPLKMYDMIGAGLPFLGTAVGQIKEFCLKWGIDEMLIQDNKPSTMAEAISYHIKNDLSKAKKSVYRIAPEVSWNVRAKELIQRMEQML